MVLESQKTADFIKQQIISLSLSYHYLNPSIHHHITDMLQPMCTLPSPTQNAAEQRSEESIILDAPTGSMAEEHPVNLGSPISGTHNTMAEAESISDVKIQSSMESLSLNLPASRIPSLNISPNRRVSVPDQDSASNSGSEDTMPKELEKEKEKEPEFKSAEEKFCAPRKPRKVEKGKPVPKLRPDPNAHLTYSHIFAREINGCGYIALSCQIIDRYLKYGHTGLYKEPTKREVNQKYEKMLDKCFDQGVLEIMRGPWTEEEKFLHIEGLTKARQEGWDEMVTDTAMCVWEIFRNRTPAPSSRPSSMSSCPSNAAPSNRLSSSSSITSHATISTFSSATTEVSTFPVSNL